MKKLVVYLMAMPETPALAATAVEAGADLVELGFPFSDPLADGPVIRRAGERALAAGMRTRRCLDVLAETRARIDVPLIPMTYSSILDAYGWDRFAEDAKSAGATSLIVADLPADVRPETRRVQLVAPTSTDARLRLAAMATDGWLYLVTVTGTTGARTDSPPPWPRWPGVPAASPISRSMPASGSRPPSTHARQPSCVDGIVVGSRRRRGGGAGSVRALMALVSSLRAGLDAVASPV